MRVFARTVVCAVVVAGQLSLLLPEAMAADPGAQLKGLAGQLLSNAMAGQLGIQGTGDPKSEYAMTAAEIAKAEQARALFNSAAFSLPDAPVDTGGSNEKYMRRSFKEVLELFHEGVYNPYNAKQASAQKERLAKIRAKASKKKALSQAESGELMAALLPFMRYDELFSRYHEKSGEGLLPHVLMKKNPNWTPGQVGAAEFSADGHTVVVPPRSKVKVKAQAFCMDSGRPAPRKGEPLRLVKKDSLVQPEVRGLYADLGKWATLHPEDHRRVQVLIWGLRHAGSNHPYITKLNEDQCRLLDAASPAGCMLYQAYLDLKQKDFKDEQGRLKTFNALGNMIKKATGVQVPPPTASGHTNDADVGSILEGLGRLPVAGQITDSVQYTPLSEGVVARTVDTSGYASHLEMTLVNTSDVPYSLDANQVIGQAGPGRVTQRLKIADLSPAMPADQPWCAPAERERISAQVLDDRRHLQAALCAGKSYLAPMPGSTRFGPVRPGCQEHLQEQQARIPTATELKAAKESRELLGEVMKDGKKLVLDKVGIPMAEQLAKRMATRKMASRATADLIEAVPFLGSALSAAEVCTGRDWLWGDRMSDIERVSAAIGIIPVAKMAKLGINQAVPEAITGATTLVDAVWSDTSKYMIEEGSGYMSGVTGGRTPTVQMSPDVVETWCPEWCSSVFGGVADGTGWVAHGLMNLAQGDTSDGILGSQYLNMQKTPADPEMEQLNADLKKCDPPAVQLGNFR